MPLRVDPRGDRRRKKAASLLAARRAAGLPEPPAPRLRTRAVPGLTLPPGFRVIDRDLPHGTRFVLVANWWGRDYRVGTYDSASSASMAAPAALEILRVWEAQPQATRSRRPDFRSVKPRQRRGRLLGRPDYKTGWDFKD